MSASRRRHARNVTIVLVLLVLGAWWVPSLVNAERYRRTLVADLGQMLGRRVDFASASFNLVPRPGFSLHGVVVEEDPHFGTEPFARIDEVECDLRLRSLWRGHLDFVQLRLEGATLNLVRDGRGEWNVENLLGGRGSASSRSATYGRTRPRLVVDADGARLNFKIGANKKSFAITDLSARLSSDPFAHTVRFRLTGSPIRTDSPLPTPGALTFSGSWKPGDDPAAGLNAVMETSGAMLYDWVPLVTGRNPGIYGVLDSNIRLSGGLGILRFQGQARLAQLRRWESLPPSGNLPVILRFRGQFDRTQGEVAFDSLDAAFASSRVHVTGRITDISSSPRLNLAVALDRARLEDLFALGRRLRGASPGRLSLAGALEARVAVQGAWQGLQYSGFATARDASLNTPAGAYPLSDATLRLGDGGARLEPVTIAIARGVEVTAEGAAGRIHAPSVRRGFSLLGIPASRARGQVRSRPPQPGSEANGAGASRYELSFMTASIPVTDLIRFARSLGAPVSQNLNARGVASAEFRLSGPVRPFTAPAVSGHLDVFRTRLYVPGVTEAVDLSRAHFQISGKRVIVGPLTARVGTSTFAGRLEHDGDRKQPWQFDIRADRLNLNQGALWFDALGHRPSLRLLDFLPGLSSLADRLAAGSNLLSAIDAQGQFFTPDLSYGALHLRNFQADVGISKRVIRISRAAFNAAGGRGQGSAEVSLASSPPRVRISLALDRGRVQTWAVDGPEQLRKVRGVMSGTVDLETQGLTHDDLASNLRGTARARLTNVDLGGFDPLAAAARWASLGTFDTARGSTTLAALDATFLIRNRRVTLTSNAIRIAGGLFDLAGTYDFDGTVALRVRADLRHTTRRWLDPSDDADPDNRVASFQLSGRLDQLTPVPAAQAAQVHR